MKSLDWRSGKKMINLDILISRHSEVKAVQVRSSTAMLILLGLICYQFLLCFANTNLFAVTNSLVALTEGLLLALLAWRVMSSCRLNEIMYVVLFLFYFMLLWVCRGVIDLAGPRNVLIIFLAYALGRKESSYVVVNKTIWVISSVVLFWSAVEYFFTDTYLHYFNILHYYIARGEVSEIVPTWIKQNTFVSGLRLGGRNLFPFLGDLRVSSVFLEPVSMGNYAIILTMWSLSFDMRQKRVAVGHLVVALILIVASDSRFASILVLFLFLLRFTSVIQKRLVLFLMPVLAVLVLIVFTLLGFGDATQDNLAGRLARTGQAISDMNITQLIGLGIPDPLPDMGIAYALEHFGLFLCIILWLIFVTPKLQNDAAGRYRAMLAIYCLGILAVSGTSFFSAKTAAIAWFLYGFLCSQTKRNKVIAKEREFGQVGSMVYDSASDAFERRLVL